jgi:hypothetical protein
MSDTQILPPMPDIGRAEAFYAKKLHEADKEGDPHKREAWKVAQYVTLGIDPHLDWDEKLKYFKHAITRHCEPPPLPDEAVWVFYRSLANVVKQYAGQEALRLASQEDDLYAARLAMGQARDKIEDEAEVFFGKLVPPECPLWLNDEDYQQLRMIRDQWI